jgi:hypothetical protein
MTGAAAVASPKRRAVSRSIDRSIAEGARPTAVQRSMASMGQRQLVPRGAALVGLVVKGGEAPGRVPTQFDAVRREFDGRGDGGEA